MSSRPATTKLLIESHLCRGGFPHSDICGSKLVCQLPAAFRRLPRPSSPVIAKASTTCTYSLDPITTNPRPLTVSTLLATGSLLLLLRLVVACHLRIPCSLDTASPQVTSMSCVDPINQTQSIASHSAPSLKVKPHPTSRPPQHPIALLLPVC